MNPLMSDLSDRLAALHEIIERAIDGLPDDALDWSPGNEMNTLGVLLAHTFGSQRYWIGDVAGQEPSDRVRASEFKMVGVGVGEFKERSQAVLAHSNSVLARLTPDDLGSSRTVGEDNRQVTAGWAILHALEHTALHAGHIEITRQLWEQHQAAEAANEDEGASQP